MRSVLIIKQLLIILAVVCLREKNTVDQGNTAILGRLAKHAKPYNVEGGVCYFLIGENRKDADRYDAFFDKMLRSKKISGDFRAGVYRVEGLEELGSVQYEIRMTEKQLNEIRDMAGALLEEARKGQRDAHDRIAEQHKAVEAEKATAKRKALWAQRMKKLNERYATPPQVEKRR